MLHFSISRFISNVYKLQCVKESYSPAKSGVPLPIFLQVFSLSKPQRSQLLLKPPGAVVPPGQAAATHSEQVSSFCLFLPALFSSTRLSRNLPCTDTTPSRMAVVLCPIQKLFTELEKQNECTLSFLPELLGLEAVVLYFPVVHSGQWHAAEEGGWRKIGINLHFSPAPICKTFHRAPCNWALYSSNLWLHPEIFHRDFWNKWRGSCGVTF